MLKLPVASFKSFLTNRITSTATSCLIDSMLDDAGGTLSGVKGFVIDEGTTSEETVIGTCSSTGLTSMLRGISPVDGATEVTALKKPHLKNATVKISSHPYLVSVIRMLNGTDQLDPAGIPSYSSAPAFTPGSNQIPTVKYIDDIALSGSPDASETTKGIVEAATSAEVAAGDDSGSTTAPTFVRPSKLAEVIQKGSYLYFVEDGSGSDDAYVGVMTPAVTSYTAGMIVVGKITVANGGACTLDLGGGAVAVKKWAAGSLADLETNDVAANYTGIFEYDGTYFVLLATSAGQLSQAQITSVIANASYFTAPYTQPVYRSVTAAEGLEAGELVVATSGGAALTNPTAWLTQGSVTNGSITSQNNIVSAMAVAGVVNGASSSFVIAGGSGASCLQIAKVGYNATTGAVTGNTLVTLSTVDAGATNTYLGTAATQLASDKVLVAYKFGAATYTIRAKIFTPSSAAEGAEVLVAALGGATTGIVTIMPVSASEVVILYTDGVGLKFVRLTISGTTITVSTTGTVLTDADLAGVVSAKQFGTSGYYLIAFHTSSTSRVNYVLCQYSAGVFSNVTAKAELSTTTTTTTLHSCELYSLSDTKMLAVARLSSDVKGFILTRTAGAVAIDAGTTLISSCDTTKPVGFAAIGAKTFVALAKKTGNDQYTYAQMFKVKNSYAALETISSTLSLDGTNTSVEDNVGVAFKVLPSMLIVGYPYYSGATSYMGVSTYTLSTNYESYIGVCGTDTAAAASAPIVVDGTKASLTGLTAGQPYYADMSGDMNTLADGTTRRVGVADTTTSLIVK